MTNEHDLTMKERMAWFIADLGIVGHIEMITEAINLRNRQIQIEIDSIKKTCAIGGYDVRKDGYKAKKSQKETKRQ